MTELYKPRSGTVEHVPTKYDACVLRSTGKDYRAQKGSGRSEMLSKFAAEGKTFGEIAKEAAAAGYETSFVVPSILKHCDSPQAAWRIEPPEGFTMEEIKKQRQPRRVSPEALAKREAAAAERAAKVAEREAAKAAQAEAAAAKAQAREDAKAAKVAEQEAKKAERAAARAAAPKKGKGKGKSQGTSGDEEGAAAA